MLLRAAEQAAEAIIVTDRDGTIVYANSAFERVSGWSCDEVLGENPRILRSGQHDEAFYRRMWQALESGAIWTGRLVNRRKDGTLFEEEATISPVRDAHGEVVNYVAVKRDITDETRLMQQLLHAQKMEAIGRLAGGVAHDFNNLLGVIVGYGDVVQRRLAAEDPLKAKVEQILRAAERAAALTQQLLAIGRRHVVRPEILDLSVVVADVEKMLERLIGEDVELRTRLEPNLGTVRADRGQIEQVIMNLVVNARDAMPDGGRITIETRRIRLVADHASDHPAVPPGSYVMLAITDTGCGMDTATRTRMFEPFFSTKQVGKGTGLGLSTVYGIVQQSEGHLEVESEVGVGTSFRIYLPRLDGEAPLPRQEEPQPLPRGDETVLLVEDEASLRELLREALVSHGYSVLAARDGAEAIRVAEAHAGPIHILVTDVVMPGMTGPKIVDIVAQTRPRIRVVYMSGYGDEAVVQHSLLRPGTAFLGKPFGLETLLRRIRMSLDALGGSTA